MSTRFEILTGATLLALATFSATPAAAQDPAAETEVQRLLADTGGAAQVSVNPATGAARFVRLPEAAPAPAGRSRAMATAAPSASVHEKSREFLATYGRMFGITNVDADLTLAKTDVDPQGGTHITYGQNHRGVPVFGTTLKTHFDAQGQLRAVNGTTVPGIDLNVTPARSAADAGKAALARVSSTSAGVVVRSTRLVVYRAGLLQGVKGPNHLAWEVEVGNGSDVREFVIVDAQLGKAIDQFTGVHDAMFRRAYDGLGPPNGVPASYPGSPFWQEGQTFPTGNVEADNMLVSSDETYHLFSNAFGRDSWDGTGGIMDQIFNRGYSCPNASWNGAFISFCAGFTTDDVTGHEWAHAYTERTHNLIYAWQPGALNESYSDIWGETLDRINARGANDPGPPRSADGANCSGFQSFPPEVRVNAPDAIAADYPSGTSAFSPPITSANTVTANVVRPNDGVVVGAGATLTDGCCAGPSFLCAAGSWTNAGDIVGKIVLVDRGLCGFNVKAVNAQRHGAAGVIIANVASSGAPTVPPNMAGAPGLDPVTIPTTSLNAANGDLLRGALVTGTVNATLQPNAPGATDNSNRWLMGEDVNAVGFVGALRDMWNPNCFGNAGKVSDTQYTCSAADQGGVHSNSGVPNHAFALLVDGGSYNGQTVAAIGLTKAAHIYYRAQSVYQGPTSDFVDHADALEASCDDLLALPLKNLDGTLSVDVITPIDCDQVASAVAAVELRTPPTQCGFVPLLAKNPPDRCEAGTSQANVYANNFEALPVGWTVSHTTAAENPDFTPRDWEWTNGLPDRDGSAMFGVDFQGGTCAPGGDESGVIHLFSPTITIPVGAAAPRLTFDHWVSTEAGWDGGNLKISRNGGAWQLVAPADYTYNAYNTTLFTAPQGNTNPMAGEPAFSGGDGGSVTGSWGRSHVNLANYAAPNDTVQLRFDMGTDGCSGVTGWIMDDPTVYACVPSGKPSISIGDVAVTEGNSGFTSANFKVTLSHPSDKPVRVWYITWPGTALPLLDWVPAIGEITIPPLQVERTITVKVRGEKDHEKDETFYVLLFLPHNGVIADGEGKGTILNDDPKGRR